MASFRHDQGWEQGGRETAGKPSISPVLRVELCTVVLHCPYRPALMLSRRSGTKRVSSSIRPSDDKAGTRSRHARALREARPSPRPSVERFLRQRRGQFRVGVEDVRFAATGSKLEGRVRSNQRMDCVSQYCAHAARS